MVVKISFFLSILFGVVSIYSPNNFEGVITYKRVSQTGNIAFEKYYLKNNKLKIESEFHTDGKLTLHESYFDFKNNPNQVFKIKNDNYQWVDLKESVIDSVVSTGVQEVVC
ncbi:MAG: hypothetical protein HKN51_01620, partial [Saprospiraceae bacterium]|nr:hypothetical protein [Saprospiraceae bacterium]